MNMQQLNALQEQSFNKISAAVTLDDLEHARVTLLGKNGEITQLLKQLGGMDVTQRQTMAPAINQLKTEVQEALEEKKSMLESAHLNAQLETERVDVTLPAAAAVLGRQHPVSYVMEEVEDILRRLGFDPATGPEIESDFHNFTALNLPEDHPARQEHDTFYMSPAADGSQRVLRTHTSPVQIRTLLANKPPLRVQAIGRVYRCDSDLTHTPQFHQVEGLAIEKNLSFAHLKGVLQAFLNTFFEREIKLRFRPSYFPFTEPSTEVDIGCIFCHGDGCRVCSHTGWIEVLGAGMVHRNVLTHCQVDHTQWQGFAFGCGIERLTMLKYGVNDLRLFFESHQSFLRHFGKAAAARP